MARILTIVFLGVLLVLPAAAAPPKRKQSRKDKTWITYKVKSGDTLSRIARRHRMKVAELKKRNGLKKSLLRPGQVLRIKKRSARRVARRRGDGETRRHHRRRTRKVAATGRWITYKVKRGDYLWRIADKHDVTIDFIVRVNHLSKRRLIKPGDVLRVKRRGSQALAGGVELPRHTKDSGYVRMRPLRSWGTPGTVRLLQEVYSEFKRMHPDSAPGMIADLSKEGGGHLNPHKSHQRGVDVDVSYYRKDNRRMRGLEVVTTENIDITKTWDLIKLYLNTGHVKLIFMDYKLQGALHGHLKGLGYGDRLIAKLLQFPRKTERKGMIRHSPGHHHHLHVRFDCRKAAAPCARPRVAVVPPSPKSLLTIAAVVPTEAVVPTPTIVREPEVEVAVEVPAVVEGLVVVEAPPPAPIALPEPAIEAATRAERLPLAMLPDNPLDLNAQQIVALPSDSPRGPLTRGDLADFRRDVVAARALDPELESDSAEPRRAEAGERMSRLGATR